jgi:phage-related protein
LLPIVDKAASWLGVLLPKALDFLSAKIGPIVNKIGLGVSALAAAFREGDVTSDGFVGVMERVGNVLRQISFGFQALVAAFREGDVTSNGFVGVMERLGIVLRRVYDTAVSVFNALKIGFTNQGPLEGAQGLWRVLEQLGGALRDVTSWVQDHMTVALIALGVAFALLIGPVVGTIAALAALTGGVIYAYNHFETFRTVVDAVVTFFRSVLIPGIGAVVGYITDQIGQLAAWWRANWEDIKTATENVLKAIVVIAAVAIAPFVFIWKHAHDEILAIVTVVWQQIRNVVDTYIRIIRDIITVVIALLSGDWGKAWDAIKDVPVAVFSFLVDLVKNAVQLLWHTAKAELEVLGGVFSAAWDGIKGVFEAGIRFVVDGFLGMVGMIIEGAARAFGWVPGLGGKLRDAAKDFDRFRDDVNAALGGIHDKVINVSIRGIERHIDPNVGGSFDDGGTVPGPAGKPQLIVAHGGEFVLSRAMLASIQASPAAMPLAGGASRLYQVNMEGAFDGPREISRQVVDNLRRLELLEVA